MGLKQNGEVQCTEEAAMWLQRLHEQNTPEVRAEFSAWIRSGARNLEEFLFAQAIWKELDHIDPPMRQRLWPAESPDPVIDFPSREPVKTEPLRGAHASPGRRWFLSAAALLMAVALGWIALSQIDLASNVYVTKVGEQKSVRLGDGSLIHLNTNSRAVVNLTETERVIRLTEGEALFTVAHDAQRPFYVLTDNARVRALGTKFNVYRSSALETRVGVVDGRVQVSSLSTAAKPDTTGAKPHADEPDTVQLAAGDEADVDRGRVIKAKAPNIERAVSWQARKLMFAGNPVSEIVEQFNRYNKVAIRLEGAGLQNRRMSGVFDADDPSPLLRYLAHDPAVEVISNPDEIVIRPRNPGGGADGVTLATDPH